MKLLRNPHVEDLARFRGISYEEAAKQFAEANAIDEAESMLAFGKKLELIVGVPLFEDAVRVPLYVGKHMVYAENGKFLKQPRPSTKEEDDEWLIEETEKRMTEGPDGFAETVKTLQKDSLEKLHALLEKSTLQAAKLLLPASLTNSSSKPPKEE